MTIAAALPEACTPDLAEARRFLAYLDPQATTFTFQTFKDRKERDGPNVVRVLHGSLDEHAAELTRLNRLGAGVFVTVNKTDGAGRKAENIVAVRAIWHEDDKGTQITFHCRPSLEVETSPGKCHRYWFVDDLTVEEHRGVMEHMDFLYDSDPNAKDVSRVLRLPGFGHMKGNPFQTRITRATERRYLRDEILAAFPAMPASVFTPEADQPSTDPTPAHACEPLRDNFALAALRYDAQLLSETPPSGGDRGGRNAALNVAAVKLGGFVPHRLSRSEVEAALLDACNTNGLTAEGSAGVRSTMRSGLRHGMATPRQDGMPSSADADFGDVKLPTEAAAAVKSKVLWVEDQPMQAGVAWLIDEAIPEIGIGFLVAKPGMGKTFLAVDLALSTANGLRFFGRAVAKRGGTHIIAAEGAYSIPQRIRAAIENKFVKADLPEGVDSERIPITFEKGAPDLLSVKGFAAFILQSRGAAVGMQERYGVPLRLIIIDTFGQAFTLEDENSAANVAKATQAMQRIADEFGIAVMAVHHFGKDERAGLRGSSALRGNADFILAVKTEGELTLDKCRDAAEGKLGHFSLQTVTVGKKTNGDPLTSLYVSELSEWPEMADLQPSSSQHAFDESFDAALEAKGVLQKPPNERSPVRTVRLEDVRQEFYKRWGQSPEANRKAFLRVKDALPEKYQRDELSGEAWVWMSANGVPRDN